MIQATLFDNTEFVKNCELLVCADDKEARQAYNFLAFAFENSQEFAQILKSSSPDKATLKNISKPFLLPEVRMRFGDDLRSFRDDLLQVFATLGEFYSFNGAKILCAPVNSVLYKLPDSEILRPFEICKANKIQIDDFVSKLLSLGYENTLAVEMPGEISVRADIVDIFLTNSQNPHRICFFDDEIESIREFDISTQMSFKQEFENLQIAPALFFASDSENVNLDSQNSQDFINQFWSQNQNFHFLSDKLKTLITPKALQQASEIYEIDDMQNALSKEKFTEFKMLDSENSSSQIDFSPKMFASLLKLHKDKKIFILAQNLASIKAQGIDFTDSKNARLTQNLECNLQNLNFIKCTQNINLLTKNALIISFNTTLKAQKRKRASLHLNELNVGEFIVHSDYGIGVFNGLKSAKVLGVEREFVEIAYQGEDRLLLPVDRLDLIERYVADSGNLPIVDKLGKNSFIKLKDSVRKKLFEIAQELINIAAARALIQGLKIETQTAGVQKFKDDCAFELTADQEKSINEIFDDLSSGRIMDRLLSGDVGFGKTEVAMNAINACASSGYQCAFLAPTTLLTNQHFYSLSARFCDVKKLDGKPLKIARLDRYVSSADKKQILNDLKNGNLDIIIGTHGILGAEFSNLGLVVIDEEHKFGVKQKEKIKQMCKSVHILSMSATPIPRTLNMALSSIKGFSTLRTPPLERKGVRTFVKDFDNALIREAILRERRRGGQIFYIHNNIASIENKKKELQKILPDLRIEILHSQVDSADSETIMEKFVAQSLDVLLSTSIIESGLHLPNANTIIVEEANRFGIADLHQLRGRVGRGDREGFCYLFVKDFGNLGDEAKKRLNALEKNSYLGSGENLAYHDLEIRGGGNLIGQAQSGHIKKIGYSLYLSMLEDCINSLSGKGVESASVVDLKFNLSAFINAELVSSDKLRLELYRRLSLAKELSEVFDIEAEIENRFGKLDSTTLSFLEMVKIRILANQLKIKQIAHYGQNITITFGDGNKQTLQSSSRDWDDVLGETMRFLRSEIGRNRADSERLL